MLMSDVITPPHFSAFLLLTPPHSSSTLLLTPPPHSSSLLLHTSPHSSSTLLLHKNPDRSASILLLTFCPIKYSVRASVVCSRTSSTQLIFSHSLKQTIILTFDKLCINLIEFNHFATDFAKNIS